MSKQNMVTKVKERFLRFLSYLFKKKRNLGRNTEGSDKEYLLDQTLLKALLNFLLN